MLMPLHSDRLVKNYESEEEPVPFDALIDTGILWALNRYVLHPRGLALSIVKPIVKIDPDVATLLGIEPESQREALGFSIDVSSEPFHYDPDTDAEKQEAFESFVQTVTALAGLAEIEEMDYPEESVDDRELPIWGVLYVGGPERNGLMVRTDVTHQEAVDFIQTRAYPEDYVVLKWIIENVGRWAREGN